MRTSKFIGRFVLILGFTALTSCGTTLISTDNTNSFVPKQRMYYAQSKIFNQSNFKQRKEREVIPVKLESDKPAIEALNEVHNMVSSSFTSLLMQEAETYLGTPYRYGGSSRRGIDCSAFVQRVFEMFDYDLPRVSAAQAKQGFKVAKEELKAGDLVFFATNGRGRVSHVGIVHSINEDGEVDFIHASTSQGVTVTPLANSYWSKRFLYAKRII